MKTLLAGLLLAGLIINTSPALASAGNDDNDLSELQTPLTSEWRLVREDRKHNIRTWMRQEDGRPFRSFRVEAEMTTSLDALFRLMVDFANYDRWYWQVQESKLLKKISPTEYLVYLVHKAPMGIPDRNVIMKGSVSPQTRTQKYIELRVTAEPEYLPPKPGKVRMPAYEWVSKFTPLGNGKVLLETEGYVDPGHGVPTWAANFVQRSAPYTIVLAMQRQLQSGDYDKGAPLPFPTQEMAYSP